MPKPPRTPRASAVAGAARASRESNEGLSTPRARALGVEEHRRTSRNSSDSDGPPMPPVNKAVARKVNQWADEKDIYDMLDGLSSLGLQLEGRGADEDVIASLQRETATAEMLERAWSRVESSLTGRKLQALPPEKRGVARELYRVLKAAYKAELIVLEEIGKAEAELYSRSRV